MLLILSRESIYLSLESIFTPENALLYVDFILAQLHPIDHSVDDFIWWYKFYHSYHIFNHLSIIFIIKHYFFIQDFTRCYLFYHARSIFTHWVNFWGSIYISGFHFFPIGPNRPQDDRFYPLLFVLSCLTNFYPYSPFSSMVIDLCIRISFFYY